MTQKLTGQAYIDHWKTRIARGPHEAGTIENGNDTWQFITQRLPPSIAPKSALEFGCAYGRMLRHLREQWPEADLYGVDLCRGALDHLAKNWHLPGGPPRLFNQNVPPTGIEVDLIFTCTVLQHVTDRENLQAIADGFRAILNPNGYLILFENVNWGKGQGGSHMNELTADEYMNLWPELQWRDCGALYHRQEAHELLIGKRVVE